MKMSSKLLLALATLALSSPAAAQEMYGAVAFDGSIAETCVSDQYDVGDGFQACYTAAADYCSSSESRNKYAAGCECSYQIEPVQELQQKPTRRICTMPGTIDCAHWTNCYSCTFRCLAKCLSCESGGETGPFKQSCRTHSCTPVVIALDQGGFRFTGLEDPVEFDVDADGVADTVGWTDPSHDQGFLVLDRNGNGRIDDGGELFGAATEQPDGEDDERHGFRALALFDQSDRGGNGDGRISSSDPVYALLRLWIDEDHDGISQPHELVPLAGRVDAIGLDVVRSERRDRFGNLLRWSAHVEMGRRRPLAASDVILISP